MLHYNKINFSEKIDINKSKKIKRTYDLSLLVFFKFKLYI